MKSAYSQEAEDALHTAVQASRIRETYNFQESSDWFYEIGHFAKLSPDEQLIYFGGPGGGSLWDIQTKELIYKKDVPNPETDWFNNAEFSPDGSYLVLPGEYWTTNEEGEGEPLPCPIIILDLDTGEELVEFIAHEAWIQEVTFSPDGSMFATASGDGTKKVWDLQGTLDDGDGRLLQQVESPTWASPVQFSSDSLLMITTVGPRQIDILNIETGQLTNSIVADDRNIHSFLITPDGKYIVQGTNAPQSQPGLIHVRDLSTGEILSTVEASVNANITGVAISPDGQFVASRTSNENPKIWRFSPDGLEEIGTIPFPADKMFFRRDSSTLVTTSSKGVVYNWDILPSGNSELAAITGGEGIDGNINDFAFIEDGKKIATVDNDGTIKIWDTVTWQMEEQIQANETGLYRIAVSPDGNLIAVTTNNSVEAIAQIWDVKSRQLIHVLEGHQALEGFYNGIIDASFSPDGVWLATAGADGLAIIWDVNTGEQHLSIDGHHGEWVHGVAFSPDSKLLVTAGQDWQISPINIWDTTNGQLLHTVFNEGAIGYWNVSFSPNSNHILAGNNEGTAVMWEIPDDPWANPGSVISQSLSVPTDVGWAFGSSFSQDGHYFVVAGDGNLAEIRVVETGELVQSLPGPAWISEVGFSPDGKTIVTVGMLDGILRAYTLDVNELVELAQTRVTRSLTDDECRQYLHQEDGCLP